MGEIVNKIRERLEMRKSMARGLNGVLSAWSKGVYEYAFDLIDEIEERVNGGYVQEADLLDKEKITAIMLNGADNWYHYSETGCAFAYDEDIAERLCTPSQFRDMKKPKRCETWIDVQAIALRQAATQIQAVVNIIKREEE